MKTFPRSPITSKQQKITSDNNKKIYLCKTSIFKYYISQVTEHEIMFYQISHIAPRLRLKKLKWYENQYCFCGEHIWFVEKYLHGFILNFHWLKSDVPLFWGKRHNSKSKTSITNRQKESQPRKLTIHNRMNKLQLAINNLDRCLAHC